MHSRLQVPGLSSLIFQSLQKLYRSIARKCQEQRQERPCLRGPDHHPRPSSHPPSRVSTWSGSLLSAAELSMRRNIASDSAAWLCSRVEDSPKPSAPAGEILRTRSAGNHRPGYRLGPVKNFKISRLSVVDGGRTVGSRPRRQGIVAPQLLGESVLRIISENFALISTAGCSLAAG